MDIGRRVNPQGGIEEDVVQQLPRQKGEAEELSIRQVSNLSCYSHFVFSQFGRKSFGQGWSALFEGLEFF